MVDAGKHQPGVRAQPVEADPDAIRRCAVDRELPAACVDPDRSVGRDCVADPRLRADRGDHQRLAQASHGGKKSA